MAGQEHGPGFMANDRVISDGRAVSRVANLYRIQQLPYRKCHSVATLILRAAIQIESDDQHGSGPLKGHDYAVGLRGCTKSIVIAA